MDVATWKNNLSVIKVQRNYALVMNVILALALTLSLVANLIKSRDLEVTLLPAMSQSAVISSNSVSESYLTQWAEFIASLKLNVTPDSVALSQNELLNFVSSDIYGDFKASLLEEQKIIKASEISTTFHPKKTKVIDSKNNIVEIAGHLRADIGNEPNKSLEVKYKLGFEVVSGRLLLKSFEEIERV